MPSIACMTGDDTGLLKRVRVLPAPGTAVQRYGVQAQGGGVACCCWGPFDGDEAFAGVGLASGAVRFWRAQDRPESTADYGAPVRPAFERSTRDAAADAPSCGIVGLHATAGGGGASAARVLACDSAGMVRVWRWHDDGDASAAALADHGAPLTSFETSAGRADVAGSDRSADAAATRSCRREPRRHRSLSIRIRGSAAQFEGGS